jgi:hypothetical protein
MLKHFLQQPIPIEISSNSWYSGLILQARHRTSLQRSHSRKYQLWKKWREIANMAPFRENRNPTQIFVRWKGNTDRCYKGNGRCVRYRCRKLLFICGTCSEPTSFLSILIKLKIPSCFLPKSNSTAARQPSAINLNMRKAGTEKPTPITFTFNVISSSLLRFPSQPTVRC